MLLARMFEIPKDSVYWVSKKYINHSSNENIKVKSQSKTEITEASEEVRANPWEN